MIAHLAFGAYKCSQCQYKASKLSIRTATNFSLYHIQRQVRYKHDAAELSPQPGPGLFSDSCDEPVTLPIRWYYTSGDVEQDSETHDTHRFARYPYIAESLRIAPDKQETSHGPVGWKSALEHDIGRIGDRVEKLSKKSLGKDAEIIVIPDELRRSKSRAAGRENDASNPPGHVDILARLDAERGLVGKRQVDDNIEALRPLPGRQISWEEFRQIEKELNEGFTALQLTQYIADRTDSAKVIDQGKSSSATPTEHYHGTQESTKTSPWVPGVVPSNHPLSENIMEGYVPELSYRKKQRLVVLLMRQCWEVEVNEIVASQGQLEIHVSREALDVLIKGTNSYLRALSDKLLQTAEDQIEVFRSRNVIRVTSPKADAKKIAEAVRIAAATLHTVELDLRPLSLPLSSTQYSHSSFIADKAPATVFSDAELREVGHITSAVITSVASHQIRLSGLSENSLIPSTSPVASSAENARRLLLAFINQNGRSNTYISTKKSRVHVMNCHCSDVSGLPWYNRLRSWSRWLAGSLKTRTAQVSKSSSHQLLQLSKTRHAASVSDPELDGENGIVPGRSTSSASIDTTYGHDVRWDSCIDMQLMATVGHVLHERKDDERMTTSQRPSTRLGRTTFLPKQQNISLFLRAATASEDGTPAETTTTHVKLQFVPSPWTKHGRSALTTYPHIEMALSTSGLSVEQLHLSKLEAIVDQTTSLVMLTDRAMDLSFRQKRLCQLQNASQLESLQAFISGSRVDTVAGTVSTPASLVLPIAKHLCRHPLGDNIEHESPSVSAEEEIEYLLVSQEFRTSLETAFQGWKLTYTSVNGGAAEGRRSELTLHERDEDVAGEAVISDEQRMDFYASAYNLVDALEYPGTPAESYIVPELKLLQRHSAVEAKDFVGIESHDPFGFGH